MTSPLLRLYIAASLDGFIATADGGVSWLDPYNEPELGYDQLMKSVGTVVMILLGAVRNLKPWMVKKKKLSLSFLVPGIPSGPPKLPPN